MDHDQVVRMTQMIEEAVTFGITNGAGRIISELPNAKERRRYQLLQAAAPRFFEYWGKPGITIGSAADAAITETEVLLAEIERRES